MSCASLYLTVALAFIALPLAKASCQYVGIDGKRPEKKDVVAVCPGGPNTPKELTKTCVDHSKSTYTDSIFKNNGRVVVLPVDEISMSMCEDLCTKGWKDAPEYLEGGKCRGYTVRTPYDPIPKSRPNCLLIPPDARNSSAFPDELHFYRTSRTGFGATTPKRTFVKENCDCGTKYLKVRRPVEHTELAFLKAQHARLTAEDQHAEAAPVASKIETLKNNMKKVEEVIGFDGVYDYLPIHIPHRIAKGKIAFLPMFLVRAFGGKITQAIPKGMDSLKHYWESPVRITNVYKKSDFSAVLYKCKSVREEGQPEHWYLATRHSLEAKAAKILKIPSEELANLKQDQGLQVLLFFNLECMGYRLEDDNTISTPPATKGGQRENTGVRVAEDTLSNGRGIWSSASGTGCVENEEEALKIQEKCVINDILADATKIKHSSEPLGLLKNDVCQSLLLAEDSSLSRIDTAKTILEYQGPLKAAWATAEAVNDAWNWGKNFFGAPESTTTTTSGPHVDVDKGMLLERTLELVEAMKQILIRMNGIKATGDERLKMFCAKEMLDLVQNVGGLWPKISQNLAVRPDVVPDDYARNKLKETQSGNKNRGKAATLAYIKEKNPKVMLGEYGEVPILSFMDYSKFLSAGSVGQVDVFEVSNNPLGDAFKKLLIPGDWQGRTDKFIVKTVFSDTEEQYHCDFELMRIFFTKLKAYMPANINLIWDVMKNMQNSIFDEFDLRKEAAFTQKGRSMLKSFTETYLVGKDLRATTPVGLKTSSKYVMIQTFAQGIPLKNHLDQIKGQWDSLVEWRTQIYGPILRIFGYTAVQHGFFQSDPHPGNWYWDRETRTLSLIDWGGVEDWTADEKLEKAHCNLARLYSSMGRHVKAWSTCDSVRLDGQSKETQSLTGTYKRVGVSVYPAGKGEDALVMGYTYAFSYEHTEKPLSLWYDGTSWKVSEVRTTEQNPYVTQFEMVQKEFTPVDQSFFGNALALDSQGAQGKSFDLEFYAVNRKGELEKGHAFPVRARTGRTPMCNLHKDRTDAYQIAARQLGIELENTCQKYMFIDTDTPDLQDTLRTAKRALVCIYTNDEKELVAKVGVPPKVYKVDGTLEHPKALKITLGAADGDGEGEEREVLAPLMGEEVALKALTEAGGIEALKAPAVTPEEMAAKYLKNKDEAAKGFDLAGPNTRKAVLTQVERMYAFSAALFDSDVAEAALQGLRARQGLALFRPGKVPEEFTLFARCVVVFHGMVADVLRENALRLVPVVNLQWLLQGQEDGFFQTWYKYADAYVDKAGERCPVGGWKELAFEDGSQTGPEQPLRHHSAAALVARRSVRVRPHGAMKQEAGH